MSTKSWTVLELLRWTTDHFAAQGIETPRLDAEVLLAFALESDRLRLYVDYEKPVSPEERARFRELVRRRAAERIPVAHLTGRKEFWSLPLRVSAAVLVPRPETETLVQAALDALGNRERELAVLDVGTGSGAVALALARELPKASVTATDLSEAALAVARENADALGLGNRVYFAAGDLFAPAADERFDAIVSNPPYLASRDAGTLAPELAHEPAAALFAGSDGLAVLERLVAEAPAHLVAGGVLAVEIDPSQAVAVQELFAAAGFRGVERMRDLAGRARVVIGRRGEDA